MISLIPHSTNERFIHPTLSTDSRDQSNKSMDGKEMEGNGRRSGNGGRGRKERVSVGKGGKEEMGMNGKRVEEWIRSTCLEIK